MMRLPKSYVRKPVRLRLQGNQVSLLTKSVPKNNENDLRDVRGIDAIVVEHAPGESARTLGSRRSPTCAEDGALEEHKDRQGAAGEGSHQ